MILSKRCRIGRKIGNANDLYIKYKDRNIKKNEIQASSPDRTQINTIQLKIFCA